MDDGACRNTLGGPGGDDSEIYVGLSIQVAGRRPEVTVHSAGSKIKGKFLSRYCCCWNGIVVGEISYASLSERRICLLQPLNVAAGESERE